MKLGHHLREARKLARLSITAAAEYAGIARSHLSDLERSRHAPTLPLAQALADVYGMSVSQLIGDEPKCEPTMNARERRAVAVLLAAMRGELWTPTRSTRWTNQTPTATSIAGRATTTLEKIRERLQSNQCRAA